MDNKPEGSQKQGLIGAEMKNAKLCGRKTSFVARRLQRIGHEGRIAVGRPQVGHQNAHGEA